MLISNAGFFQRQMIHLVGRGAGFVSNAPTSSGAIDEGVGFILISSIIGAFCGLLFGFVMAHLSRFLSVALGRNLGGYSWIFYGAAIGAALFAAIAVTRDDD